MSESNSVPDGFRQIPGFPSYAIDEHGALAFDEAIPKLYEAKTSSQN